MSRALKIINETKIPTKRLREIVRFAAPPGKWTAEIRYAYGKNAHGVAGSRRCTIWIPKRRHRYPMRFRKGGGYLGTVCYSLDEVLVDLTAHELRHCQRSQMKVRILRPYRGRRKGRAGSEGDCDMYALRKLRAWRRLGIPAPDARLVIPRILPRPEQAREALPAPAPADSTAVQIIAKLERRRKLWLTKQKRANTVLRHINSRLKRLRKIAGESC